MSQQMALETDEALVRAARAGDSEAFTLLVSRYRAAAFAYSYAYLQNREEAEDATQEAFLRALQALPHFRKGERWGAWLMRILRNHCADVHRRRRSRPQVSLHSEFQDPAPSPEFAALSAEQQAALQRAIAQLPDKKRIPLLMHYVSGRTYREIALALGLSESTVTGRLRGAMLVLRRQLAQEREL